MLYSPSNEHLTESAAKLVEIVARAQEVVSDAQRQLASAQWDYAVHLRTIANIERQRAAEAKREN